MNSCYKNRMWRRRWAKSKLLRSNPLQNLPMNHPGKRALQSSQPQLTLSTNRHRRPKQNRKRWWSQRTFQRLSSSVSKGMTKTESMMDKKSGNLEIQNKSHTNRKSNLTWRKKLQNWESLQLTPGMLSILNTFSKKIYSQDLLTKQTTEDLKVNVKSSMLWI